MGTELLSKGDKVELVNDYNNRHAKHEAIMALACEGETVTSKVDDRTSLERGSVLGEEQKQ